MKKKFKLAIAGLLFASAIGMGLKAYSTVSNDFTDFWTIKGIGTLINTAIVWIDNSRDLNLYDGDIVLGAKGNQPSTTAGEYPGYKVQIKNCGTAAWVQGTVVVADTDAAGCGQTSVTSSALSWLGISEGAVAVGAVGSITVGGYALALTSSTVNRGDVLVTSVTTSGYLWANAAPTSGADVGVAISSGVAAGGLTIIRLR